MTIPDSPEESFHARCDTAFRLPIFVHINDNTASEIVKDNYADLLEIASVFSGILWGSRLREMGKALRIANGTKRWLIV
jgi:hypothetical protein